MQETNAEERKKSCYDCGNFNQHYAIATRGKRFLKINCGNCIARPSCKNLPLDKGCEKYKEREEIPKDKGGDRKIACRNVESRLRNRRSRQVFQIRHGGQRRIKAPRIFKRTNIKSFSPYVFPPSVLIVSPVHYIIFSPYDCFRLSLSPLRTSRKR
jgi:hypothetical protein